MHAGALLLDQVLCQPLPPPPDNPLLVPFTPDPTRSPRQNLEARTGSGVCAGCHRSLNPVAFVFDGYDPVGRHRTKLDGFDIDTSGALTISRDADGSFRNLPELMALLAGSRQVTECQVTHWLRYALGRMDGPGDAASLARAHDGFARASFDVLSMLTDLVQSDSFVYRLAN